MSTSNSRNFCTKRRYVVENAIEPLNEDEDGGLAGGRTRYSCCLWNACVIQWKIYHWQRLYLTGQWRLFRPDNSLIRYRFARRKLIWGCESRFWLSESIDGSSRSHRESIGISFTTRKLTRLTNRSCANQRLANRLASSWSPVFAERIGRESRMSRWCAIVWMLEARSFTRTLFNDLTVSKGFIHEFSHRWRSTFVGEARTSDVIASRRLASDWLSDDIIWKCVGLR